MNVNKNLHSKTSLTEFARNFEGNEKGTILTKLVNKIYVAYNNVNSDPTPSSSIASCVVPAQDTEQIEEISTTSSSESSSSISIISGSEQPSPAEINKEIDDSLQYQVDATQGRTPVNVIKRISNLLAMKNKDLNDYKNTDLQKFWMPDSTARECYDCSHKFTAFRRKHHCRLCCQIFCSKCCSQIVPGKIIKCSGDLRVCTYCSKVVLSYLKSSDINADLKSDLQALEYDLSSKFVGNSSSPTNSNNHSSETSPRRKISVGYQEERLVSNANILSNADRKNILQQSNSLKALYEDMISSLPFQNKGYDLMNFLILNQKANNKQQASAVLNAMIEAGFIVPFVTYDNDKEAAIGSDDSFRVEFNENLFYKLPKIEDIPTDTESQAVSIKRSESFCEDAPVEDIIPPSIVESLYSSSKDQELHSSILSTAGSKPLLEAYCEHEEHILAQLLRSANLDQSWSKVLIPLCARIAHTIHPEFCRILDSMDVRNFVNIKKIPDGTRNECVIVGGVVFSKNVAHKDMKTKIDNPRVLLLQCPIAYQRVEGKFVTIESLILQEREYLRNVVSRILALAPDVVLVHKNVAGIAQDMLRDNGITLVLDVKLSVFERLSRCLQCDIVTSIESNIGRPKLGTCNKFYMKNFLDMNGMTKSLMFFDIPYSQRGCSLLLRGGPENELAKLKKVVSFILFARYNFRLELSFLLDLFAQPPAPKPNIFDSIDHSPSDHAVARKDEGPKPETPCILVRKEKLVNIENVADFSDPLRNMSLSPSSFEPDSVEFEVQHPFDNNFRSSLSSTILSVSPFVLFPLPYLETESGKKCILRKFFPIELFHSKQWMEKNEKFDRIESPASEVEPENLNPLHPFLTMKITAPADNKDVQTALADYRRNGGRYPKVAVMKKIEKKTRASQLHRQKSDILKDTLLIYNHQRLPVLFCSYYFNTRELPTSFCAQPTLLDMHFYGQDDIMLGLFLERYCFRSSYICPSCKLPMMDHVRRYAHSMGVVQVKLDEDPTNVGTNILVASRCTICSAMTPSVTMSPDTWCLSFAKFLELKFHGHSYKRRHIAQDDTTSASQIEQQSPCHHSLLRDHIQYFSSNGVIVSLIYTPIEIWEIKLPCLTIQLKMPELIDNKLYGEKIKSFSVRGYEVYAKIHEKLANLSSDVESPMLASLKKVLHRDQLIFKHRVEVVYTLLTAKEVYLTEITDAMFMMHKELADSIELWGPRLHDAAIQTKNSLKNEVAAHVTEPTVFINDELEDYNMNQSCESNDLELDLDGGLMTKSVDELQVDNKKEKIDKKTIKKLLSTLLPSSSDQNPLPSPFLPTEHYCLPIGQFPVLVQDQDLSSIIAYSLMSYDYKKALENQSSASSGEATGNNSPSLRRKNPNEGSIEIEDKEGSPKDVTDKNKKQPSNHIETIFLDSVSQFTCKSYFAKEFDELRGRCLTKAKNPSEPEDTCKSTNDEIRKSYARSLSQSMMWEARGGKSGSKFSKTSDDRFILKEMSKQDVGEFEKFAPHYFEYVNECIQKNLPTLLAKIFGVYKVIIKKKDNVLEKSVLVIENLFCDRKITNKYDLKGSERNRLVDPSGQTGETVLLDENLIKSKFNYSSLILAIKH